MQETQPTVGVDPVAELVLRFLRAGHRAGYPTADARGPSCSVRTPWPAPR
jgi:hypothetical protein